MPLRGRANEGSTCTTQEASSALPGIGSSWQGSCWRSWKELSRKFTGSQMEKEQNSLSGPAIAKQTGCLSICLGGHEEELVRWEEETQLADGKGSGSLPPSLITLGLWGYLLPRPGDASQMGGQEPSQDKTQTGRESGAEGDQFADGLLGIHFPRRPSFCLPGSHRGKVSRAEML